MSDSPQSNPKEVEQGAPSPDEDAQMNDPQDPHSAGHAYEFEVKEQDRWLPIANGRWLSLFFLCFLGDDSRVVPLRGDSDPPTPLAGVVASTRLRLGLRLKQPR